MLKKTKKAVGIFSLMVMFLNVGISATHACYSMVTADEDEYVKVRVRYNVGEGGYFMEDETKSITEKEVEYTKLEDGSFTTEERWKTPSRRDVEGKKWMFDGWYTDETYTTEWLGDIGLGVEEIDVYAKWLEYEDLELDLGDRNLVIMDRNLGATSSNREDEASYGNFYQWGNNFGFSRCRADDTEEKCRSFKDGEATTSTTATDWEGHISTYYNSKWITKSPWNSGSTTEDNLWGGGELSNTDEERQGPCPDGYHVPDTAEWVKIYNKRSAAEEGASFAETLKIPLAGYRDFNSFIDYQNEYGYLLSSTPHITKENYAYNLRIAESEVKPKYDNARSNGYSVRCVKNTSDTITFYANNQKLSEEKVRWWEAATEDYIPKTPVREHASFLGWYEENSETAFKFGSNTYLEEDLVLYAKYQCDPGYIENDEGTACEKIGVIFYTNSDETDDYKIEVQIDELVIEGETTYSVYYPDDAFSNIQDPVKKGHIFKGWYLADGTKFIPENVQTDRMTKVYAKWEKDSESPINNGGSGGGRSVIGDLENSQTIRKNNENISTGEVIDENEFLSKTNSFKILKTRKLTRGEMAVVTDMLLEVYPQLLDGKKTVNEACDNYIDRQDFTIKEKKAITKLCEYAIMGIHQEDKRPLDEFMVKKMITNDEFSKVINRVISDYSDNEMTELVSALSTLEGDSEAIPFGTVYSIFVKIKQLFE